MSNENHIPDTNRENEELTVEPMSELDAKEVLERMARSFHNETDDEWFCLKKRAEMEGIQAALRELVEARYSKGYMTSDEFVDLVIDITELEL